MYSTVNAEMARHNITIANLIEKAGLKCTVSTLSLKLNEKQPLSFEEALAIKKALEVNMSLEDLFKSDKEATICA